MLQAGPSKPRPGVRLPAPCEKVPRVSIESQQTRLLQRSSEKGRDRVREVGLSDLVQ